jgi:phage-related minor tail protein
MISLEYARKSKEIEGSPEQDFLTQQLDRQEALEKLNVTIQDSMQKTQQVFDAVWNNMSSAIDNFVKTGKLSFKDFARSVIQDMLAMEMKIQAMQLLRGLIGSFFSARAGIGVGSIGSASTMAPGGGYFADGGDPPVGKVSIVGERGPELFVPRTAGTIVPNHALTSMGSTTNVTNNYINAIDAKSFEQRLLESNQAIWSANQYANKNLSTNFGRT